MAALRFADRRSGVLGVFVAADLAAELLDDKARARRAVAGCVLAAREDALVDSEQGQVGLAGQSSADAKIVTAFMKIIGYDASPKDQKRVTYACNAEVEDEHYEYRYLLQEWGWDRDRCIQEIIGAGLPVPVKSSCIFCAAMQPEEVEALEPDELRVLVRMEARARPRFKTAAMKGLWGRDSKKRPGSMTKFIREKGLLPAEEIDRIIAETPKDILEYQAAFQRGESVQPFGQFIEHQLIQIQGVPLQ